MSLILHFEKKKGNNGKILRVISVILHPNFPDFLGFFFWHIWEEQEKRSILLLKEK